MNDAIEHSYRVLELKPEASPEEIKRAYRDLVKVWHPDRFGSDPALQHKAQEKLKEINAAYERLVDFKEGKPSAEQTDKNTRSATRMLQVDRFVYYDEFCDEVVAPSQFPDSEWGKTKPTEASVRVMDKFAKQKRAVEYLWCDATTYANRPNIITHTDFTRRKIYLNQAAPFNMKGLLIPLGMFFIRDKLKGIPKGNLEIVRLALKSAGWNGATMFQGDNYLLAELVLSDRAAECILDRTLNKKSEWSVWRADFGAHLKLKYNKQHGLADCSTWIGYNMLNEPIGDYSFRVGR